MSTFEPMTLGGGATQSGTAAPGSDDILYPYWTKVLNLEKELRLKDFSLSKQFNHVANIIVDKKETRQTVIEFAPIIDLCVWKKKAEWIYIFTVNDRIVKIGKTSDSLQGRCGSYLCGHHIPERGKSRDCSKTNGFIYNTFDHYARNGAVIEMWAFEIPTIEVKVSVWGVDTTVRAQVYDVYETGAMDIYSREAGHYPPLSDNSSPSQRTESKKEKYSQSSPVKEKKKSVKSPRK